MEPDIVVGVAVVVDEVGVVVVGVTGIGGGEFGGIMEVVWSAFVPFLRVGKPMFILRRGGSSEFVNPVGWAVWNVLKRFVSSIISNVRKRMKRFERNTKPLEILTTKFTFVIVGTHVCNQEVFFKLQFCVELIGW